MEHCLHEDEILGMSCVSLLLARGSGDLARICVSQGRDKVRLKGIFAFFTNVGCVALCIASGLI